MFSVKKAHIDGFRLSLSETEVTSVKHESRLSAQETRGSARRVLSYLDTGKREMKTPNCIEIEEMYKETKYLSFPPLHTHDSPHVSALSRQALLGQSAESNVSLEGGRGGAYLSL